MKHELKTWSEYFIAILSGEKKFEVRKNDRDYKVGDLLMLREYNNKTNTYSGAILQVKVKYILDGGEFGIEEGYCVMSIEKMPHEVSNIVIDDEENDCDVIGHNADITMSGKCSICNKYNYKKL